MNQRDRLLHVINAAIDAVRPNVVMERGLTLDGSTLTVSDHVFDLTQYKRILVIGAGKASAAMAQSLEKILGDYLEGGMVVTKYGHSLDLEKTQVMESDHPVPDDNGERAANELLRFAKDTHDTDLIFFLLSGGASALIPLPKEGITLQHKQLATRLLLESGATIHEINALRKHLSRIKGGQLARSLSPATVVTLIISDVVGNDLDVIGSGPTAPDTSTYADCLEIIERYDLGRKMPDAVLDLLEAGALGREEETVPPEDSCFENITNLILGDNTIALQGAAEAAQKLGYTPSIVTSTMTGEAREVARELAELAAQVCAGTAEAKPPVCLLCGGETTVTVTGDGKGGRNQHCALAIALELDKLPEEVRNRISVVWAGTDGTDGPTDAAGGLILPGTLEKARAKGLDPERALVTFDAYPFLEKAGALLITGPTRTNVMDVVAVLVDAE